MRVLLCFLIFSLISCDFGKNSTNNEEVPKSEMFFPVQEVSLARLAHAQTVYVPVYSSINNKYDGGLFHLTAILSIRNTSSKGEVIISQVKYFDTNGKLLRNFIDRPFSLGKMASKQFVIPESDLAGGVGASFIIRWETANRISVPLIESIMIGVEGTKSFSFTSRGYEIESH